MAEHRIVLQESTGYEVGCALEVQTFDAQAPVFRVGHGGTWRDFHPDFDTCAAIQRALFDYMSALGRVPSPPPHVDAPAWPWVQTVQNNPTREGWAAYFAGRKRDEHPFPPERTDLHTRFCKGWDLARERYPNAR